jgi:hypothetical protein
VLPDGGGSAVVLGVAMDRRWVLVKEDEADG